MSFCLAILAGMMPRQIPASQGPRHDVTDRVRRIPHGRALTRLPSKRGPAVATSELQRQMNYDMLSPSKCPDL